MKDVPPILEIRNDSEYPVNIQTRIHTPETAPSLNNCYRSHKRTGVGREYLLMGLNVHSNFLRLIRDGGKWGGWVPIPYHLFATLSPPELFCNKVGSRVTHFNFSLIVRAKTQDFKA